MKRVFNAKNARVGRLATVVAKSALLGDEVIVVNCESAIISGTKKTVEAKWRMRMGWGQPTKGPFFPRMPDRFVRRIIRGMLPYKNKKGIEAYRRIQCYLGVPEEFSKDKAETISNADVSNLRGRRFVTIKEVCRFLGGKVE